MPESSDTSSPSGTGIPSSNPATGGSPSSPNPSGGGAEPAQDTEPATPGGTGGNDDGSHPKKRRRSRQDTIIEAYITDASVFLKVASGDAQIRPLLEARGYDESEYITGRELVQKAHAAFGDRATAMGDQTEGTELVSKNVLAARETYLAFRAIARAGFTAKADRIALSLTGDVPEDTSRFITLATASYHAGQKPPYDVKLARRGYSAPSLDEHLAALEALTQTIAGHDETQGDAIADTATRDTAYHALKEFMKELKGTARGALRSQPALLAKLGL